MSGDFQTNTEIPNSKIPERGLDRLVKTDVLHPIPAIRMANKVVYVNPKFVSNNGTNTSLAFKLGDPSNYAYQVALANTPTPADATLYARWHNKRSAIFTKGHHRIASEIFPYIDVKGIGLIDNIYKDGKRTFITSPVYPDKTSEDEVWGLATKSSANVDIQNTEKLAKFGMRIVPTVAMAEINEILGPEGEPIAVDEAKKKGMLSKETEPVIVFRALKTPFRMIEVALNPERRESLGSPLSDEEIKTTKAIVSEALLDLTEDQSIPANIRATFFNTDNTVNIEAYMRWISPTIGRELGIMHRNRVVHGFLGQLHNFTLDGRIMDFDSLDFKASQHRIQDEAWIMFDKEYDFYKQFLSGLPQLFDSTIDPDELLQLTKNAYYRENRSETGMSFLKNLFRR